MKDAEIVAYKPKVPMAYAAGVLADLCQRLDDGEAPGVALVSSFKETELDLADAVDRRIVFVSMIEGAIEEAKRARDAWADKIKKLNAAYEAFEANTVGIIKAHPDLPFKGELGKLSVKLNPPKLVTPFGDREISPEDVQLHGIDPGFVRIKTSYHLDKAAVKEAIKNGASLDWAKLEQETSLKVTK